ncbi:HNH endonuclease [Vibrio sp.]|nr:HNH endonuclease [Vibrio sp.]
MPKFIDDNKQEVNSEFSLESISNFDGLVIESWGPSTRNPEYAKAFELLLERLKKFGLPSVRVFVVSSRLIKAFPNILDREISIDGKLIFLANTDPEELRVKIGKEVAELKDSPSTSKSGNRYKRILIYSPLINRQLWQELATSNKLRAELAISYLLPTSDRDLLDQQVDAIESFIKVAPKGKKKPNRNAKQSNLIDRDPLVKAWILQEAKGVCELCESNSPFIKDNGKPYLEVHHVLPLANGGSDTISNAVGICPNCHRALHYSKNRHELANSLYKKVARLVIECN